MYLLVNIIGDEKTQLFMFQNLKFHTLLDNLLPGNEQIYFNASSVDENRAWITKAFKTKVLIYSEGTSYWLSPIDFLASCSFSIKNFPFDTQRCSIKFGPWTDDISKIYTGLIDKPIITSHYTDNGEWDMISATHRIVTDYYKCCPIPFRDLVIELTLKRKPLFYIINSVVPCICLIGIIMIAHRLPPQSGERITLTIMICLTCIVLMEYTNSRVLPQTSEVSTFSKVFLTVTIVASFSVLETCYVLSVYHRGESIFFNIIIFLIRYFNESLTSCGVVELQLFVNTILNTGNFCTWTQFIKLINLFGITCCSDPQIRTIINSTILQRYG